METRKPDPAAIKQMDSAAVPKFKPKDRPMSEHAHKPEDAIERLFQEKAREYEIPYREEDWLKLKKRLDRLDQQKGLLEKLRIFGFFRN